LKTRKNHDRTTLVLWFNLECLSVPSPSMNVDCARLSPPAPECAKHARALAGKTVDLTATGAKDNASLLKLLTCCAKVKAREGVACTSELAAYNKCHSAVMSTGSYEGGSHCGRQLPALLRCVDPAALE
jgi:hypothetical protein